MSHLPLIIGHRGSSALAPENTLAAFRHAIADGADGIEFDVRLSSDGVAVVIHDPTLERTGLLKHRVSHLTAADLQTTDVGTWFRKSRSGNIEEFDDETVPLLSQVFELFEENDDRLYLEMKADQGTGDELAVEVVRSIRQAGFRERVVVECFDLELIKKVKTIDSGIRTAALFERKLSQPSALFRRHLPEIAQEAGANEIALHHSLARPRIIEQALCLNQQVVVWTVADPIWVRKARTWGIVALITNNPSVLIAARESDGV